MRQEQKPGLLSDCARAASAGLRNLSSPLSELASKLYIAGRSEAERAIANCKLRVNRFLHVKTKRENQSGRSVSLRPRFWGILRLKMRIVMVDLQIWNREMFLVFVVSGEEAFRSCYKLITE
ncbi:hypothetical protein CsSME_00017581 [Camellia sinensis var. sinensis]